MGGGIKKAVLSHQQYFFCDPNEKPSIKYDSLSLIETDRSTINEKKSERKRDRERRTGWIRKYERYREREKAMQ